MKIHEVCKQLNLTKKAINYYEQQGLVFLAKDVNGYRIFNETDIDRLRVISLYRRLDMSVTEIRCILDTSKSDTLRDVLKKKYKDMRLMLKKQSILEKMIDMELTGEIVSELLDELSKSENDEGQFILTKFESYFPGGIGQTIASHFGNFRFDKIQTSEQNTAWLNIVNYIDDCEELMIPDIIMATLNHTESDQTKTLEIHTKLKNDVLSRKFDPKRLMDLKEASQLIYETIENEDPIYYKEFCNYQHVLAKFFGSEAYQKQVIDNMKILSSEYREYHNELMLLDTTCIELL